MGAAAEARGRITPPLVLNSSCNCEYLPPWRGGRALGRSQRWIQITAPNSTDASDSGSYGTRTIDKEITAVMAVTFRVK